MECDNKKKMINFCTLFDSYYLDKGIALYHSLSTECDSFRLFIFCFDDISFNILNRMQLKNVVLLKSEVLETEELLQVKRVRSKAEYCWTCTPQTIEYVLNNYDVDSCTYIDADIYFFDNPQILFDEIEKKNADVVIMAHRFNNNKQGKKLEARNGKYCVEFNIFKNNQNGKKVLNWWKEKCLEWCYDIPEEDRMGDQKYLNYFSKLFDNVYELDNLGAGVAPWNLAQYSLVNANSRNILLKHKDNNINLIFYHFQNIRYMPRRRVNIKSLTRDKTLKYSIYIPYLIEIEKIRNMLKREYKIDFNPKKLVRSSNKIIGFLQSRFASLKIRCLSDILNLDKLEKYI